MQPIEETRRQRLAELIREYGTQTALSEAIGKAPAQISQWINASLNSKTGKPRVMSNAVAREIEALTKKPVGWMDNLQAGPRPWDFNVTEAPASMQIRMYPVISSVQAGEWSEIVDTFEPGDAEEWQPSPADLGKTGFLLRVEGSSMTNPAGGRDNFPDGVYVHINPDVEAVPGDFVVAKRVRDNKATFKQLCLVDGELYLHATNPAWPNPYIKLEKDDKIVGKLKYAGWRY